MAKEARLFAVKEIITEKEISNQDELRLELKKRGFDVTQATLSRDLKKLGVSWVTAGTKGRYVIQSAAEARMLQPIIGAEILSILANESMIVIRTLPGCASAVGEFVDLHQNADIIGTIAGDNTLLIIPKSHRRITQIVTFLKSKLIRGQQ